MADESAFWRFREWINTGIGRTVAIVVTLTLVALAITVAIASRTSTQRGAAEIRAKGVKTLYVCKACGATGKIHTAFEAEFPLECPQCRKREAVAGFMCYQCKKTIEAVDAPFFRCRHCNYTYDQRIPVPAGRQPRAGGP
ncbi:hypothetical protein LCGC14_1403230 [marine sediment metagenome]|uniref:Uncharacterized protein n=1 Tax=marine sediment metagenome TaxID=412755 RepID=A0A0F9JWP6_9ZZZZ